MIELALGLIETRGLVAAFEAADAALKAADVKLKSIDRADAGLITVKIVGEVSAVQAAVDAGRYAAEKVGTLFASHVIPRPDLGLYDELINLEIRPRKKKNNDSIKSTSSRLEDKDQYITDATENALPKNKSQELKPSQTEVGIDKTPSALFEQPQKQPPSKSYRETDTIDFISQLTNVSNEKPKNEEANLSTDFESMTVQELRRYARSLSEFPIQGREISRAGKAELLTYLKKR